jgi:hypothetical protein
MQVRLTLTDLFIFKVSKQELENIYKTGKRIDNYDYSDNDMVDRNVKENIHHLFSNLLSQN